MMVAIMLVESLSSADTGCRYKSLSLIIYQYSTLTDSQSLQDTIVELFQYNTEYYMNALQPYQ